MLLGLAEEEAGSPGLDGGALYPHRYALQSLGFAGRGLFLHFLTRAGRRAGENGRGMSEKD